MVRRFVSRFTLTHRDRIRRTRDPRIQCYHLVSNGSLVPLFSPRVVARLRIFRPGAVLFFFRPPRGNGRERRLSYNPPPDDPVRRTSTFSSQRTDRWGPQGGDRPDPVRLVHLRRELVVGVQRGSRSMFQLPGRVVEPPGRRSGPRQGYRASLPSLLPRRRLPSRSSNGRRNYRQPYRCGRGDRRRPAHRCPFPQCSGARVRCGDPGRTAVDGHPLRPMVRVSVRERRDRGQTGDQWVAGSEQYHLPTSPLRRRASPRGRANQGRHAAREGVVRLRGRAARPTDRPTELSTYFLGADPDREGGLRLFSVVGVGQVPCLRGTRRATTGDSPGGR